MKTVRRTKRKKRERLGNRLAIIGITFVVLSMAVVVNMRSASLKQRDLEYQMKEESLRNQLAQEEQRAAKLEEERVYVQTKQYIEKEHMNQLLSRNYGTEYKHWSRRGQNLLMLVQSVCSQEKLVARTAVIQCVLPKIIINVIFNVQIVI